MYSGNISEIEGNVQQRYKRALFHYKKQSKGTSHFSNPYVHSIFTLLSITQILKKYK